MDSYSDDHEYGPEHIPVFQKVVDMLEGKADYQRIVRLGILANMGYSVEYDDMGVEDYDLDRRVPRPGYGFRGSSSSPQPLPPLYDATNANAGKVGASKEEEEKAEKKRRKRQKRKERKRNEKEKEEQCAAETKEEKDEKKAENEKPKVDVKEKAAAKIESEEDVSDEELSECEELDLTSTFVSKVRSKLEQKPKPEKEKKIPAKSSPDKPKGDGEAEKKAASPSSQSVEEHIRRSARLANLGNTHANAGDFKKAVQFYTDAIKHNPREYKLFGNRSFCFERMRLYMKALDDAEVSLSMNPGWVKGLFRKGRALAGLKRYEEAERAFRLVLEVDSSQVDASQELMRVQIAQVMGYGYSPEQSAHALDAQKSVKKALRFLGSLNHHTATVSRPPSLKPHTAADQEKLSLPASQNSQQPKQLYPVWVGNLFSAVTEISLEQLFNKVGVVGSVRLLTHKRCAFVNFTQRKDCEEAIRRFHGIDFNGTKLAVRYPDRIPPGLGISSAALTSL